MLCSARLLVTTLCALSLSASIAPLSFAGDLSQLNDEQKAGGFGQLQQWLSSDNEEPSTTSNKRPRAAPQSGWCDDDDDDDSSSLLTGILATALAPVAIVHSMINPRNEVSFWDVDNVPKVEFSFNETWTFESHENQTLVSGNPWAQSTRLDWTGAPGFATRLAVGPFAHLGLEAIFDYTTQNESLQFFNATDFATHPQISFIDSTAGAERRSTISSGQVNGLIRDEPYNFLLLGMRWWHHDDALALQVLPNGAAWNNETQTNTPFVQIGISRGYAATRSILINRFSGGIGASWSTSRTRTARVVGVADVADADEVHFASFLELKSDYRLRSRIDSPSMPADNY